MSTREEQREVLARVAEEIIRRRMTTPAIFMLEGLRPLSFVASQLLVVIGPFVQALLSLKQYGVLCDALEDRSNLDWLLDRLEAGELES